ncbi:MAG: radical SAM protein [Methanomicrobiales archaeon]
MQWTDLKARLLSVGSARITGKLAESYIARSAAGPGAGVCGAVFFAVGKKRVKLALNSGSAVEIAHHGMGVADLHFEGAVIHGRLLEPGCHCPDQAFITVTGSCIFHCRYCPVPLLGGKRKTIEEIKSLVEAARHRISAISITSGVMETIEEEESYVLEVIEHLCEYGLPIGVSIYPTGKTPDRLLALGVTEVKFNIEAATPAIFAKQCPGLDYEQLWRVLDRSVELFGKGRVFSNVIIGLGETDGEMQACIRRLSSHGIIPVLRPLNPVAELKGNPRPTAERLKTIFSIHERELKNAGLNPKEAFTMCTRCAGCDLVPGRD